MVYLLKAALVCFAVIVPVLAFELGLRLSREKMDYLAPELTADPILGYRIESGTGGHDEWGFRNLGVPEASEVVVLGDSNTWGVAARWDETWPSWYARRSGRTIYNLGVSGYGPPEYLHLMETKALLLNPELIIVGLYYGNDFHDTYRSVSDRDRWESFRTDSMKTRGASKKASYSMPGAPFINDKDAEANPIKRVRNWLRRNSMLFRIIEEGPIGTRVNAWGDQRKSFGGSACTFSLDIPFSTVVQVDGTLHGMDLATVAVEEGLELSLYFLKRLFFLARENGVEFLVVLIPSKVAVLMTKSNPVPPGCEKALGQVLEYEAQLGERVQTFLLKEKIPFVDTLSALRKTALERPIYSRSADSHPNGEGYEVIADQIVFFTGSVVD